MYIIIWLLFGAVVGWIASIIMKTNHRMGLFSNIIIGLVGSALGLWIMSALNLGRADAFSVTGFLVSIGGAALLIAIINALTRR